jgi:hypothetical protein
MEEDRSVLAFVDDGLVIVGPKGKVVHSLSVDDAIEVYVAGAWQSAVVCSGGYKGLYYETATGLRGRFATSMRVRLVQARKEKSVVEQSCVVPARAVVLAQVSSIRFVVIASYCDVLERGAYAATSGAVSTGGCSGARGWMVES